MTNEEKLIKKNGLEGLKISQAVEKDHPYNDEIAILRKTLYAVVTGAQIPTEFFQYNQEVENKKAEVKARLS